MNTFDAQTVTLAGLNLIEASAGTGKTYTLAELYLRLLLEKDFKVEQILVVTYTRAATEELRDRLRQKLVDARDELSKPPSQRKMLVNIIDPAAIHLAKYKLIAAIQGFDEAAIFTIHGFCQRVLGDFAFESGLRFELELIGDDLALLQSATDDFWRREITTADKDFVAYLLAKNQTPETLLSSVRNLVGKPYVQCLPVAEMDVQHYAEMAQSQFETVQNLWHEDSTEIIACLNDKTILKARNYRADWVKNWLSLLLEMIINQPSLPDTLFEQFDRFTPARLNLALHDGMTLPDLGFWSACEALIEKHQQLQQARELQLQRLRLQLLAYLRDTLPQQKLQQQVQSYDDLLINLEHALQGQRGDWLVAKLREQYPAALIDEFQDTDPVQYASFSRIYADSGLPTFLVGDPKQAIYSFRGADIFTYLQAKSQATNTYTLTTNWRSHLHLVTAVNSLFKRQAEPFIYQDIPFNEVDAERKKVPALQVAEGETAALQLLWAASEKPMTKGVLSSLSANVTADEIARLLNAAESDAATLRDDKSGTITKLAGGDIAVLVRNHRQATQVQQCLQQRGINSVQQGRDNVFTSSEALMLERILLAVAEPTNQQRISSALATRLWGLSAAELYQLKQDDSQWLAQLDLFYDLHQLWLKHGFMRMFRHLLLTISAQQRLLILPDGERQLTNLNHLAELIQAQSRQQQQGIEAVLHWFSSHIQSAEPNDETAQLRLESDEQLVKIITIHKSKGLEYPIVFCPFLWDVNLRAANEPVINFHQHDSKQACAAFAEPALSQAAEIVTVEERAEDLRLLYVALTRARERCIIMWGNVKGIHDAALFSLLHPRTGDPESDSMAVDLTELAQASEGTISVNTISEQTAISYVAYHDDSQTLAAKPFAGTIQTPWRIGSFSALTIQGHDAEVPDYDAQAVVDDLTVIATSRPELDRFSFPRGAQAGTCLHALFEHWDFTHHDKEALQMLVSRTLLQYGFDDKWTDVASEWLSEVLVTPLDNQGLSLNQLSLAQRLDELAFYFPVAHLTVNKLQQAVLPLLAEDSALKTVINRVQFYDLTGFMKGFIDLVFEHQGRYYIVDYKSNHLGDSAADYQSEQLNNAMIAHDYPLQYLIYTLALHRYLQLRLPDYDPQQHLGGVYYLFIRGMKADWGQAGIFFDKADVAVIDALDRCLQGLSDE